MSKVTLTTKVPYFKFSEADEKFRGDKNHVLEAVRVDGQNLKYTSAELKDDEEIVFEAVKHPVTGINAFEFASERLKNDRYFVLRLLKEKGGGDVFQYVSNALKNDKDFVLEVVKIKGSCLHHASDEMKNDKEVVMVAVKEYGPVLSDVSERLKNDKEVVLEAMKHHYGGNCVKDAGDSVINDKEVLLEALKRGLQLHDSIHFDNIVNVFRPVYDRLKEVIRELKTPEEWISPYFEYVSEEMKSNKEFVMEVVRKYPLHLQYASERIRNDKEVVLQAVRIDGSALEFAGECLKDDKEVVLAAVTGNPSHSLNYATWRLKNDPDLVLKVFKEHRVGLEFGSLMDDFEFVQKCCLIDRSACSKIGKCKGNSQLASLLIKYSGDVEWAIEEFESNYASTTDTDPRFYDLCYKLLAKPSKGASRCRIAKRGVELEKKYFVPKQQSCRSFSPKPSLGDGLGVMKTYLNPNEFKDVVNWKNDVCALGERENLVCGFMLIPDPSSPFFSLNAAHGPTNSFTYGASQSSSRFRLKIDVSFEDLQVFRLLGRGAFGSTYLCKVEGCRGLYVVKIYQRAIFDGRDKEAKWLEKDSLYLPSHENTVTILHHSREERLVLSDLPDYESHWKKFGCRGSSCVRRGAILVMKYYPYTLQDMIDEKTIFTKYYGSTGGIIRARSAFLILKGVLSGCYHLHKNKIVHRDLHSGNIFVLPKENRVWIGDFGCCLDLRKNSTGFRVHKDLEIEFSVSSISSTAGCSECQAPEILGFEPQKQDFLDYSKSDLFSCGVLGEKLYGLLGEMVLWPNPSFYFKGHRALYVLIQSMLEESL